MLRSRFLVLFSLLGLGACVSLGGPSPASPAPNGPNPAAQALYASGGMVAAADARAVDAGLAMLNQGGSAADAAIASMAVLGLVEPQSAGLGGGGFLLHYDARKRDLDGYDGRETAPAGVDSNLFLDAAGKPLPYFEAAASGRSIGAPGLIPMLKTVHQRHGRLAWAKLFAPAIALAEEGFLISPRLNRWASLLAARGGFPGLAGASARAYLLTPEGKAKPVGTRIQNPDYARVLRAIAAQGPAALQTGPIAEDILAAARLEPSPSTLTNADLAAYRPRKLEPLCGPYRAFSVCSVPPPASGGIAIPEMLGLFARARPQPEGPDSTADWAAFLWASRLAYADRDHYLADPAFVPIPSEALRSPAFLDARASLIRLETAAPALVEPGDAAGMREIWGRQLPRPEAGTTHLTVLDKDGNSVALTATIEAPFGSQRMAAGFFLNNQLTDFSFAPSLNGKPLANAVAPGKRPRSSMAPTMIFDGQGHFYAALGSPGGNAILAYVAKTAIGLIDWNLPVQAAIDLPNVVARGQIVRAERDGLSPALLEALRQRGWMLEANSEEASGLHAIVLTAQGPQGGADKRREGVAKSAASQGLQQNPR